jgi:CHAT domain-containing protein/Flp pilus assembly protein TadD
VVPFQDSRQPSPQALYDRAEQLFKSGSLILSQREAEAEFQRYRNTDPKWAVKFQLLEANSMLSRGMYQDAISVLRSSFDDGPSDGAVEKGAIEAISLLRQQNASAAEERLSRAESICRQMDFSSCGDALTARGIFLAKVGKFEEARRFFLQALDFGRRHANDWLQVSSLVNLGYTSMQVDRYDDAVGWLRAAYQAASAHGYENFALVAAGNLGWAYFQLGDDDRALEQFLAAEMAASRLGNIRNELKWLSNAGHIYRDSGDWTLAAQSYRRSLGLAHQIDSREDIVNSLENLADISVVMGKPDDAASYIRQATMIETANGARPSTNLLLTMGKLAAVRGQYPQAEVDFRSIEADPASLMTIRLNAGFELAEIAEAQGDLASAEAKYRSTLASYEAARAQLKSEESQLPFGTNAAQIYDHYIHLLVQQGKSGEALAVADASRAQTLEQSLEEPGARKRVRSAQLDPQQVARKTGSALLFYWLGEKQSYLWTITGAKTAFFTLPSRSEIAGRVARYQKALLDLRDPQETGNGDGQALYQELVAPAAQSIHPGASVIILADGILSQLNFETLQVPDAARGAQANAAPAATHYLIDDFTISSAPSMAMLAAAGPVSAGPEKILLLGNPVSPNQDFPSLPMFGFEMSRIESHFAQAQISAFGGEQATPAAYVASNPRNYSYIHFVSHAVASQTNPLDSAIILSNSQGQEDSYKLYAREIIQHPIDARLVTISACYGSGTRAYAGEGLVGLSWAFLRAGAQRVIGALWEVSDESTPRLMDTLYQGLTAGERPSAALRNAKLSLLHSQSRFRIPYYWAPFQMYRRQ